VQVAERVQLRLRRGRDHREGPRGELRRPGDPRATAVVAQRHLGAQGAFRRVVVLCRYRHKTNYADVVVMPMLAVEA